MILFAVGFTCSLLELVILVTWCVYSRVQPEALPIVMPVLFFAYVIVDCAGDIVDGFKRRADTREWKALVDEAVAIANDAVGRQQAAIEKYLDLPPGALDKMVGRN